MKNRDDRTIEALRAVPGLGTAPRRVLAGLAPLVDHAEVVPGHVLAREGAAGRQAFIVLDGEGDVYVDGERVAVVTAGDFVGEMAMLDRQPRSATVRARTAMRVLVIGPAAFAALVENSFASRAIALQLAARLRRIERRPEPAVVGVRPATGADAAPCVG